MHQYAERMQTDPRKLPDLKLAALLASGRLHKQSALYCIMRFLGDKALKIDLGMVRTNQSALQGVSDEDMCEAGFFLASTLKDPNAMKEFGVSLKSTITVIPDSNRLPSPFMSIATPHALQRSIKAALENLQTLYSRNYTVGFDESVFGPGCRENYYVFDFMEASLHVHPTFFNHFNA